jgi:hypothetical protein
MAEHIYVVGKSGYGKSTFLENHAITNQSGWLFLDPHGDSALKLADTVRCHYWAPDKKVIGFNPIADVPKESRHLAAYKVVEPFKAIFGDAWGSGRMADIFYNSALLLIDNNLSLVQLPKLLTNHDFRKGLYKNASYLEYWTDRYDGWPDRYRDEAIEPVLNKVGQFLSNPVLSAILRSNSLNPQGVIDRRQRWAVNLSKADLGEASNLLGALLVSAFTQAAMAGSRTPFTIYADEFQNFATDSFALVLSEARKFGLSLIIAHQYLGQVPEALRQAVFGNVQRFVVFNVGAEDAPLLARELDVHPSALQDQPKFTARIKSGLETKYSKMSPPLPSQARLEFLTTRP